MGGHETAESYLENWQEKGVSLHVATAIKIAAVAHERQLDKSGKPYIFHPLTVMSHFDDPYDQMAAVLHDVLEDTPTTKEQLLGYGIPFEVINTVDALTRREGETVKEYYIRIKKDERAVRIKMKDLEHNMDISRFKDRKLRKEDINRLKMYHEKYLELWRTIHEVSNE